MTPWLVVAHIAVPGYWLGSELVINSTYRFVCYRDDMAFDDRSRLMDHVMNVDQHVRYALALQVILGAMLAAEIGYLPGGRSVAVAAVFIGALWLGFIDVIHRLREQPLGKSLAGIDRALRYVLLISLLALGAGLVGSESQFPAWLRWKLALFAGVIACGIRFALVAHFKTWAEMADSGATAPRNAAIRRIYVRATRRSTKAARAGVSPTGSRSRADRVGHSPSVWHSCNTTPVSR